MNGWKWKTRHLALPVITIVLAALVTTIGTTSLAYAQSMEDTTRSQEGGGNALLCYAAGGLLLLGGVPVSTVLSAGAAAHNAGVCP